MNSAKAAIRLVYVSQSLFKSLLEKNKEQNHSVNKLILTPPFINQQ